MTVNHTLEKTLSAWGWRCLLGPAMVIDGLLCAATFGTVNSGASLSVARRLSQARFRANETHACTGARGKAV